MICEDAMNKKKAKIIAEDAIFCSLVLALLLVLAPLFGAAGNFFGMAITALFACLNQKKSNLRLFCISAVLLVLLAVFSSPYQLLSQYMWGIIAGLIVSKLLHLKRRRYYVLSFFSLLALQLLKIAFTIAVLTPMTVAEYISSYSEQTQQLLGRSVGFVATLFIILLYAIVKAALQSLVIDRFNTLFCRFILNKKQKTQ